jgi:protein-tyrosine-phosphatase
MPSVLFICTANIIRSPMAMALFRARLGRETPHWRIESAGTWAVEGDSAANRARYVMQARGLSLNDHSSRVVTRSMLRQFNLILTMERGQKEAIQAEFPEIARRVFRLGELAGVDQDVRDPIGGMTVDFEDTALELERMIDLGFERICQLAQDQPGSSTVAARYPYP